MSEYFIWSVLLTIAPYLFKMQVGCSIQETKKIKPRYRTAIGGELKMIRFPFADQTIFEVVDHFIETILSYIY